MLSNYSFLLLALCITLTASLRPLITLFTVCLIAKFHLTPGFELPSELSFMTSYPCLAAMAVLALLEIINDKKYSIITPFISILRPVATICAPLTVMRYDSPYWNIGVSVLMGVGIGIPFMRFFSSMIVPKDVHDANPKLISRAKRTDFKASINNTPALSFTQDILCALLTFLAFRLANIVLIAQIVSIFLLVLHHQRLQYKEDEPAAKALPIKQNKNVKLPNFPKHTLSDGTIAEQQAETDDQPDNIEQDSDNEASGYGYL
ncbi:DUF4126 domain-containing protein [bacterium]|nr:DUF4126 domain-containing protein [bacterium]